MVDNKIYLLFDVDGTLTPSGLTIKEEMVECLKKIKKNYPEVKLGIVGGGDYNKIRFQMDGNLFLFDLIFAECGSVFYIGDKLISEKRILDFVDREYLNEIIKKCLKEISDMDIILNGCQIDFRKGLIYVSPPGMQASNYERDIFKKKDKEHNLRKGLITILKKLDPYNLFDIVLGGEVGIAIYLKEWDKSQILYHFDTNKDTIYYFGDKTEPDGNDYPIYSHPKVKGISVKDYNQTILKLNEIFKI